MGGFFILTITRRGRISPDQMAAFLADLAMLPFEVDDQPREAGVLGLARRHKLTVYDAAYLELAQRGNLPLATVDDALIQAARGSGISVFEPRRA